MNCVWPQGLCPSRSLWVGFSPILPAPAGPEQSQFLLTQPLPAAPVNLALFVQQVPCSGLWLQQTQSPAQLTTSPGLPTNILDSTGSQKLPLPTPSCHLNVPVLLSVRWSPVPPGPPTMEHPPGCGTRVPAQGEFRHICPDPGALGELGFSDPPGGKGT
jgi:hypothetical protein